MTSIEAFALFLSTIAGLSACIGGLAIFFDRKSSLSALNFSLGFSAGIMIYIAIGELLADAPKQIEVVTPGLRGGIFTLLFFLLGLLFAALIDTFAPHETPWISKTSDDDFSSSRLMRVGIVSSLAIVLHNCPEGMATFMTAYQNTAAGLSVAIAVALHNIPEGLSVAIPIYHATGSKAKAMCFTFLTGLAEPLGAIITYLFLKPYLNAFTLGAIYACVSGIMLFIAVYELIPASQENGSRIFSSAGTLSGMSVMAAFLLLLKENIHA